MKSVLIDAEYVCRYCALSVEMQAAIHYDLIYVSHQNANHPEPDFEHLILWAMRHADT